MTTWIFNWGSSSTSISRIYSAWISQQRKSWEREYNFSFFYLSFLKWFSRQKNTHLVSDEVLCEKADSLLDRTDMSFMQRKIILFCFVIFYHFLDFLSRGITNFAVLGFRIDKTIPWRAKVRRVVLIFKASTNASAPFSPNVLSIQK